MRGKSILNGMKKGYTKIPSKIFKVNLSGFDISVYCVLAFYPEEYNPSMRQIAIVLGSSKSTVARAIIRLRNRGIIKLLKKGSLSSFTEYEFISPKYWSIET